MARSDFQRSAPPLAGAGTATAVSLVDETLLGEFLARQDEVLREAERWILALGRDEPEALEAVRRFFHTLKGEAGLLELEAVASACHAAEDLLHQQEPAACVEPLLGTLAGFRRSFAELQGRAPASATVAAAPPVDAGRVRVDAARLERLIEAIGELVSAESAVTRSEELQRGFLSLPLRRRLDHLDKISRELQELALSLRLVPVRPVFRKMARLVDELSRKLDRPLEFVMTGEDLELDQAVVERIDEPLVHLLRNAVDHGLERDPAARTRAGKPAVGRVELRAGRQGGAVLIEVLDDGRGLDAAAILARGRERGLVGADEAPDETRLFQLIFEPGFSTAPRVTEVSGRGIGMDIVRERVAALHGSVEIESAPGHGTRFGLRLPLTQALIDGLVVRVGRERYIVPVLAVQWLVQPGPEDLIRPFAGGELLTCGDRQVPLLRLADLWQVPGAEPDPAQSVVVVVEEAGRPLGLVVDELLGQQSIVIKELGAGVQDAAGLAGGAILADGRVALVLDVAGLARCGAAAGGRE